TDFKTKKTGFRSTKPWRNFSAGTYRILEKHICNDLCFSRILERKVFGDLHRVQSRTLQKLVAANPERQTVVKSGIDSDPTYLTIISPCAVQRHWILLFVHVVDDLQAGKFRERFPGFVHRNRPVELCVNSYRMGPEYRYPDTCYRGTQIRMMQNLPAFIHKF